MRVYGLHMLLWMKRGKGRHGRIQDDVKTKQDRES